MIPDAARELSDIDKVRLRRRLWRLKARPDQLPPAGWETWLCRGGRGSGKTRAGAETMADLIVDSEPDEGDWAIVAPTFGDARDVCVEGESGLLRMLAGYVKPGPSGWNRSQGQMHLIDGSTVFCDGADDGAYRIQGKNLRGAWLEEIGLWRRGPASGRGGREWWEVAMDESIAFALRKEPAKLVCTGTPKRGHPLVKRLLGDSKVASSRLRTIDNVANLSKRRVEELLATYEGTSLAAQELEGEFLEAVEGALWVQAMIDDYRWVWGEPSLGRVLIGVDPSGGSSSTSGETGIVAAGQVRGKCPCGQRPDVPHYAVLGDCSLRGTALIRARAIVECFDRHSADRVVGERNYGGDMVEALVRQAAGTDRVPYQHVNATRGKQVRAEPVAALYEQGRVHHVGTFPALEDQLCTWVQGGPSPDRLDAMVWTILKLSERRHATVRRASGGVGQLPTRIG